MPSAERVAAFRIRRRAEGVEILGGRCAFCGSTEALEFDHVDPETKEFGLAGSGLQVRRDRWLAELVKCRLLCRPCHLTHTGRQNRERRRMPIKHGSEWAYTHRRCRCDTCCLARSLRRRERGY